MEAICLGSIPNEAHFFTTSVRETLLGYATGHAARLAEYSPLITPCKLHESTEYNLIYSSHPAALNTWVSALSFEIRSAGKALTRITLKIPQAAMDNSHDKSSIYALFRPGIDS